MLRALGIKKAPKKEQRFPSKLLEALEGPRFLVFSLGELSSCWEHYCGYQVKASPEEYKDDIASPFLTQYKTLS